MRFNYNIGVVSVTNGSDIVDGTGMLWLGVLLPGDQIVIGSDSAHYRVKEILEFNRLKLLTAYQGASQTDSSYIAGPSVVALPDPSYTVNKTSLSVDGSDYVSISGLPNPSQVIVEIPSDRGIPEQPVSLVTDGEFRVTTTVYGQYKITVRAHDYNDFEVIVNAA